MSTIRAAAHVHSEWSDDASWSLDDLAAAFARRGCRVVLMAEHSRGWTADTYGRYLEACARASRDDVLVVPGVEYGDSDDVVHVPVWGDLPFLGAAPDIGGLLATVSAAGGTSVLAHPWRRHAWRRVEPGWRRHLSAVEVWNRKYDGWAPSRPAVELAARAGLPAFVGLDFHTRRQFFPLAMVLGVPGARRPERDDVFAALRAGAFAPLAFGRPAGPFTRPRAQRVLDGGERARRVAARQLRRVTG